jgi:hypothetical protein
MGLVLLLTAVPLCALLLALAQRAWYRWRQARGVIAPDDVPPFIVMLLRGLVAVLVVVGALALLNAVGGAFGVPRHQP